VSSIWSIAFQQNYYLLDVGHGQNERWNSNFISGLLIQLVVVPAFPS